MLLLVRNGILLERRASFAQLERQSRINRNIAKRGTERAFGKDGLLGAVRVMANAQKQDFLRQRQSTKNGASDRAGIDEAGMGHETSAGLRLRGGLLILQTLFDQRGERFGFGGIEVTSNGGKAQHTAPRDY